MSTTRLTTLPSGLTVVTDAMPHLKTASIQVSFGVGGRDELPDEHGISHLLEHMAFKGTTRRTPRGLAEEIEAVGGDLNAATASESTSYYAKVLGEDLPVAIDILADILTDPQFHPEELVKEKNVIVQEIGAAEDDPDDVVIDHFIAEAYPAQPLGRTILGTPAAVRSATPDKLRAYMGRSYSAPRAVVSAAGAVDHERIVEAIGRAFEVLPKDAPPANEPARYRGGISTVARPLEQTNLVFGFEGMSYRDPDIYAVGVFNNLLGGGLSSRLFQEVREERGLCYEIHSFHWSYSDTGIFGISAGTDPGDAVDLVTLTMDVLNATVDSATEAEVGRAKAQMKVGLLGALESSSSRTDQMARQVLIFGRTFALEEIVAKIDAVTVEDARAAGARLVRSSPMTFAAIGPKRGLDKVRKLAEQFRPT
ncbi:M16 family metallopeptidase [Phreatobacter oligotrophus]|uniref:M16 family metallopeptidase n=1 Tax=Phreatobacter oligotrophus TaxID=1122261 RepID=UPI002355E9C7|nr:pitrilysin family protein [Phreatobacter oligotrophus]MBX9991861.1 insulinase family protein [Phreatobacter oligotrophus]